MTTYKSKLNKLFKYDNSGFICTECNIKLFSKQEVDRHWYCVIDIPDPIDILTTEFYDRVYRKCNISVYCNYYGEPRDIKIHKQKKLCPVKCTECGRLVSIGYFEDHICRNYCNYCCSRIQWDHECPAKRLVTIRSIKIEHKVR